VEEDSDAESSNWGTTVGNVPERGKVLTFEAHGTGARDSGCQGQRTGVRLVKDRPSHYRAARPRWSCAGQAAGQVSHEPSACEPLTRSRGRPRWANRCCSAQKRWSVLTATRYTWTCDQICTLCDNTLSPPHPVGGRASQTVSPGSPVGEYPPRKETPKSTHARRRPGEGAPSDKHELCDRKFTCPRRRPRGDTHALPSYPVRSPRTLRKPSSDTLKGPSENPPQIPSKDPRKTLPSGPMGPVSAEDGRSFEYRLE